MSLDAHLIKQRLTVVREQLASEACRYDRDPASIRLVAVSKQHSVAAISAAVQAGQRDFAESYLQEALPKLTALKSADLSWHYIGQIQSNKTRVIADHFQWVHTVDREKIATRLSEQRPHYAPPLQICIQVKLADEANKGGIWPAEAPRLARQITGLPRLKLRGLMCIPPPQDEFTAQLRQFQQAAELMRQLNADVLAPDQQLDTLSMGMSGDYAAAIAAGTTIVRIGAAIFGARG